MAGFADFIINHDDAKKKQQLVIQTIVDAVKKNLVDKIETEDATIIKFEVPGRRKPACFEVCVTLCYMKKVYRGNYECVYISIVKETNSSRESDTISIDTSRVTDEQMLETLLSLKTYFAKLLNNPLVQDSKK